MVTATLEITEARKQLTGLQDQLKKQKIIWITRHNKKAFAAVDIEYLEIVLETIEVLSDPDALKMLQKSLEDIARGGCTECLGCELECSLKGKNAIKILLPIRELDME